MLPLPLGASLERPRGGQNQIPGSSERFAPGQATRFSPALDELIRWSEEHGLLFTPKNGSQHVVTFGVPDIEKSFWSARPRSGRRGEAQPHG